MVDCVAQPISIDKWWMALETCVFSDLKTRRRRRKNHWTNEHKNGAMCFMQKLSVSKEKQFWENEERYVDEACDLIPLLLYQTRCKRNKRKSRPSSSSANRKRKCQTSHRCSFFSSAKKLFFFYYYFARSTVLIIMYSNHGCRATSYFKIVYVLSLSISVWWRCAPFTF